MKKVGITGGIGSGKTLVSSIFEHLGVPVYYADPRARELMESSKEIRQGLIALLGPQVFRQDRLDRTFLAQTLFSDPTLRDRVNALVHPAVFSDFERWAEERKDKPYVVQEAAIIFESGGDRFLDYVINVYAPVKVRVERVMLRDGRSRTEVIARVKSQMSEYERQKRADKTLVNDGRRMLLPQVIKTDEWIRGS
jgi:dephospho-CoA kinase